MNVCSLSSILARRLARALLVALTAAAAAQGEPAATIDLHLIRDPGPTPLEPGSTLELPVGGQLTLLASARDAAGRPVIDWEPVWPREQTGFTLRTRGTWAELTATAVGGFTLLVGATRGSATTYVQLTVTGDLDPAHSGEAPEPPAAGGGYPVTLQIVLLQGAEERVLADGERLTFTPGFEVRLEARAFDTGWQPAAPFRPLWSVTGTPGDGGLGFSAAGPLARLRSQLPGTYQVRAWDERNPTLVASFEVTVLPDPYGAPLPAGTVPSAGTGASSPPPPPPAADASFRSEVHRLCANLDVHYRSFLDAFASRNAGGMSEAGGQIIHWATLVEAEGPEAPFRPWEADDLVNDMRDLLRELAEGQYVRDNLQEVQNGCVRCHGAHQRSSYVPPAVPPAW